MAANFRWFYRPVKTGMQMEPVVRCQISDFLEYLRSREKAIAAQAESRWLMRGCPEGLPEVDWFKAESEIDQEFLSQVYLGLPS
jgi:hypothetical protein